VTELGETIARAARLDELFGARLGAPDEDGWQPMERLCADDGEIERLLAALERNWSVPDRRAAGSILLYEHVWNVAACPVACYALERRVPDVGLDNVSVRFDEEGTGTEMALATPRFAALAHAPVVCGDEDELRAWLLDRLLDAHLSPFVDAIARRSPVARQIQRGNIATVVANVFRYLFELLGDRELLAEAERILADPRLRGEAWLGAFQRDGRSIGTVVRRTCCLVYRPTGDYCGACPLIGEEERESRWLRRLLDETAA
jgi:hypothetical protein